jgi:hypothetical protein
MSVALLFPFALQNAKGQSDVIWVEIIVGREPDFGADDSRISIYS